MEASKLLKIKNAIRNHFEESPETYAAFEEKYGFFEKLNSRLVSFMQVKPGSRILDVGCGTGASSKQMLDHIPDSSVVGVDNSPSMLEAARLRYCESGRLTFIEGDAAALSNVASGLFDAVVYSASIFLIPDYQESLRQAKELLKPHGKLGLTFMDGVYDPHGRNFLAYADQMLNEGISLKKAVKFDELISFLRELLINVQSRTENFELSREALSGFFSVPAMSAGLFPKCSYSERRAKIHRIFLQTPETGVSFRWILVMGHKP